MLSPQSSAGPSLDTIRQAIFGELVHRSLHDLRNTQTIVGGNLTLLETAGAQLVPEDIAALKDAAEAFHRGEAITAAWQRLSRKVGEPEPIDLALLADEVIATLQATLPKLPPVTLDAAPGLPPIQASAADLTSLLIALVLVTADHAPPGAAPALAIRSAEGGPPRVRIEAGPGAQGVPPAAAPEAAWLTDALRSLAEALGGGLTVPTDAGAPWAVTIPGQEP